MVQVVHKSDPIVTIASSVTTTQLSQVAGCSQTWLSFCGGQQWCLQEGHAGALLHAPLHFVSSPWLVTCGSPVQEGGG